MAFTSLISSLKKAWNGTLRHLMVSEPETVQCFEQSQCTLKNLESTLNAIPDLMFELDAQGRHCDFRALRPETLVAPPKELLGHTVAEVMPPAAAASVMSALEEAANTGFSQGNRIHLPTPMGERYFEFSIARKEQIPDEGSRFIVISRDITERHRKFEEAEHLANFDGLTDLPNRRSMQERLQLAIEAG
jgi:FOG: GGDEF domain